MMTIKNVPRNNLCTGCGTCAGICPFDAITMKKSEFGLLLPVIDENKCKLCGMCVSVCAGFNLDLCSLSDGLEPIVDNYLLGKVYGSYWGYSKDKSVRFNCASGGLCTEILVYALENNIIDGAIVTRMSDTNPLESEPFVATSKEDILKSAKSKYCPVSTNVLLNFIKKHDGKFAIVGLPCHIHGIRKAQNVIPSLKEKIVLCIGLMCSHTVSYVGTEFLLEKLGVSKKSVSKLEYRGHGWPGSMHISSKNLSRKIPLVDGWNSYWSFFSTFFFTPLRCTMCPDQNAELADISLGDAWLPELRIDHNGSSVIVTRTKFSNDLIKNVAKSNRIFIRDLSIEKVIQSQHLNLIIKKKWIGTRLSLLKSLGKAIPELNPKPKSFPSPLNLLRGLYPYMGIFFSSNRLCRVFVKYAPLPLFKIYFGFLKYLSK